MDRRAFITSAVAAVGVCLLPEAAAEPKPMLGGEFYSATFDVDFLELPTPELDVPFHPTAPKFPVRMSWVNEQIIAKAAPGTVITGWKFIGDEPLIFPEGSDGITVTNCTFKASPEYDFEKHGGVIQMYGRNHTVTGCYFDVNPDIG
jgi:hypothetical protein